MKPTINSNRFLSTFILMLLVSLSLSNPTLAKESSGIMDNYKAKRIADHTYAIFGPLGMPSVENQGFMNNPSFVITEKSIVVIDPGSSYQVGKALLEKIRKVSNKPITHVFNSHVHGDHWLGNHAIQEAFPKVKIYAHPQMIEEATEGEAENWITLMKTLTEGLTEGTTAVIPTEALENGQEIKIDDITFKAHLNELAHTKTDAMIEIKPDKVLVTGDNSFNGRMPRLDDGSFTGNIKAMDTALKLDIDVVVPGHGPSGSKQILSDFRDFLYIIYDSSKTLMDEDMEAFEMKPIIVRKLEKFQKWDNFEDSVGKLISLAVIEAENE